MNTLFPTRTGGMRATISLAILAVPGAAYAQSAELVILPAAAPSVLAQWNDTIVPAADFAPFAEQFSPAAALAELAEDALATDAAPVVALPAVAFAEAAAAAAPATPATAEIVVTGAALTDAADTENAGGQPVALADQADLMFGAAPVSEEELADAKGKALDNWMAAVTNNSSTISGNTVGNNSQTGGVNLSGSFENINGLALVNLNTGTQASLNAGMSVNVQINYLAPSAP